PFFNFEHLLSHLHNALADTIAVHRPQAERPENQQVERALEQIRLLFIRHYVSPEVLFPRTTRKDGIHFSLDCQREAQHGDSSELSQNLERSQRQMKLLYINTLIGR